MSSENDQEHPLVKRSLLIAVASLGVLVAIILLLLNQENISFLNPEKQDTLPLTLEQPFSISGRIIGVEASEKRFTFEADIENIDEPGRYVTKTFTVTFDDLTPLEKRNIARLHLSDSTEALAPEDLVVGQTILVTTQDNPPAVDHLNAQKIQYYYRP